MRGLGGAESWVRESCAKLCSMCISNIHVGRAALMAGALELGVIKNELSLAVFCSGYFSQHRPHLSVEWGNSLRVHVGRTERLWIFHVDGQKAPCLLDFRCRDLAPCRPVSDLTT